MQYSKYQKDTKSVLQKFKTAKVAPAIVELVAIGPYLVDVADPDRKAKTILTLLKADAEGFTDLTLEKGESIESYLHAGFHFGVPESPALTKRNALLSILAVNDQFKDRDEDKKAGKPNIFDHFETDAEAETYKNILVSQYSATADAIEAPEVDAIMTTQAAVATGYWSV